MASSGGFGFMTTTIDSSKSPKSMNQSLKSDASLRRSPSSASKRTLSTDQDPFEKESFEIRIAISSPHSSDRKVISAQVHENWTVREVIYVIAEAGKDLLDDATDHPNPHVADKHAHIRLYQGTECLPMDAKISDVAKRPPGMKTPAAKWPFLFWTAVTLPPNNGGGRLTQAADSAHGCESTADGC